MTGSLRTLDVQLALHGGDVALGVSPTEVWTTSPTVMGAGAWTDMFNFLFFPLERGLILWIYLYLKYRVCATTATADVIERLRMRNRNADTWEVVSDELATANIGVAWVTRITSGYILPVEGGEGAYDIKRGIFQVPFDFAVQMQTNEVNTARLEVSSLSYLRVVYKEV